MSNTIALLVTPDLAKKINGFKDVLPQLIKIKLGLNISWSIEIIEDYLPGASIDFQKLYKATENYKEKHNFSYVISLTDLPILASGKVVITDINKKNKMLLISVPALGCFLSKMFIKEAIILAIKEVRGINYNTAHSFKNMSCKKWICFKLLYKTELYIKETNNRHIRYLIKSSFLGKLQLILGMTLLNNPFNMMRSLTSSLALSFTTGAFGMIFTTMWQLSYMFSEFRLFILTVVSILGMIIWVILAHELWEPVSNRKDKYYSKLYNLTTLTTLLFSVLNYYIALFSMFLFASIIIIPPSFLGQTLGLQNDTNLFQYIEIAWFATSIATVAGAIGVGLTNDQLVKESTYGYRQKNRYNEINQDNPNSK
ncbi:5,10-methylene-tetrahydrofolate dehydrogenase [Staphylococcus gallinarum]|uniref:5,10-methylene-tetrahydrofolate dehydrogenase n=1 Tax=Staphylococcus gallinarum TaxID=1293 RepID=UPI001E34A3B6|nr:5,10-methylene-tetrahydrofolate dehydrogenase [Staphylococcus gallinarum]MCD8845236.1 5,10-methylene-tetrahydrofolate dehydrogenase [Staphylococcus gallinarum]